MGQAKRKTNGGTHFEHNIV